MSETTPDKTERNPFTRPGFILSAALVVALIAAVAVIAFLPRGDDEADTGETAPTSAASETPTVDATGKESVCGLPGSDDSALGVAPDSEWELVGTTVVPTAPATIGPGVVSEDGFRSCFAQTPAGALFAAANLVGLGSVQDVEMQRKLTEQLVVPSAGQQAALEDLAERDPSSRSSTSVQISGFRLLSYTDESANVDIAFTTQNGAVGHASIPLRWTDGDWKTEIADNGQLLNEPTQLNDLSDYIPWSGV
ncbi:hypothetical protein SAMN04488693_11926 [Arthrobacter subterraneus]|uniref:DUF8175 domain-containing protein n=1 Tax=Arthrobacter subterraneus TaxID=335973 RepID=A0A1G8MQW0_9MICC|nr:hypothetical protein [Arthrobacter subterraneus]SDI70312.1 hypothetical protein SAMN04488693_11926 [Arthrobacter subterraneus]